ncbi:MAG: TetR/AcrR family transcriptional regulator [Acidimicrobiales bacterium]
MASDTPTRRPGSAAGYHHGDLPNTLRNAASELIAERGVAGFSLREVARRAGVSHAAPAHHFGDAQGLLTAVAIEAFQYLTAESQAASAGVEDPVEALVQLGRAYVTVSVEHPGHCAIAFREDAVDAADPAYYEAGQRAFGVLVGAVRRLAEEQAPGLDVELASALCWSAVQGLATVYAPLQSMAQRQGRTAPPVADLADQFTRLLVSGLVGRGDRQGRPRPRT